MRFFCFVFFFNANVAACLCWFRLHESNARLADCSALASYLFFCVFIKNNCVFYQGDHRLAPPRSSSSVQGQHKPCIPKSGSTSVYLCLPAQTSSRLRVLSSFSCGLWQPAPDSSMSISAISGPGPRSTGNTAAWTAKHKIKAQRFFWLTSGIRFLSARDKPAWFMRVWKRKTHKMTRMSPRPRLQEPGRISSSAQAHLPNPSLQIMSLLQSLLVPMWRMPSLNGRTCKACRKYGCWLKMCVMQRHVYCGMISSVICVGTKQVLFLERRFSWRGYLD